MLARLIGRHEDLYRLEGCWERARIGRPQLVILTGPRRVGKTTLLQHFAVQRRNVWLTANTNAEPVELGRMAESIAEGLGQRALDRSGGALARWDGALRLVASHAASEPLLLVIDEFTALKEGTPTFDEQLRDVWDGLAMLARHHLMVVLTSSSVEAVRSQLGGNAPLFGRSTAQHHLHPFSIQGAAAFLPDARPRELVEAYATCGGFPRNLQAWQTTASSEENLLELAGSPGGSLLTEAPRILQEYQGRGAGYDRILRTLGHERLAHSHLHGRSGVKDPQHVVTVLEDARVIHREVPVGESLASTKRRLYRIIDPYLRFWFSVLSNEADAIEGGRGRVVLKRAAPRWVTHVAAVFEDECRRHAQRLADQGRWAGPEVGRWWGTPRDPTTRHAVQTEVAVLGLVRDRASLIGEVKWGDIDDGVFARLESYRRRIPGAENADLAVWTGNSTRRTALRGVDAFTVEDLFDVTAGPS